MQHAVLVYCRSMSLCCCGLLATDGNVTDQRPGIGYWLLLGSVVAILNNRKPGLFDPDISSIGMGNKYKALDTRCYACATLFILSSISDFPIPTRSSCIATPAIPPLDELMR